MTTEYTHPAVNQAIWRSNQTSSDKELMKAEMNESMKEIKRIGLADELSDAGLNGWETKQEKQVQEGNEPSCKNCNKTMRPVHQHDGADDFYEFWICDDCNYKLGQ